ncbi:Dynamin-2B [Hordeum vulgare]|nr:Dynamin-2B [Hordeum vulgare]
MEAMEELPQLSKSIHQTASLLADDGPSNDSAPRPPSTFLNVVVLGNVPTGENGATRAPIMVDLQRERGLNTKSIVLQIDSKSQQVSATALRHSLQDRLSKSVFGRGRSDEISLKLRTNTCLAINLTIPVKPTHTKQRAAGRRSEEPEELVSAALARTSPRDTYRATAVSPALRAVADFDDVWEGFLSPDGFLPLADGEPPSPAPPSSKKELFLCLSAGPVLLDDRLVVH